MPKRLFISWSRETEGIAKALGGWLPSALPGLQTWVSSTSIPPGADWNTELRNALADMDAGLVCLGPSAVQSPWVMFEVGAIGHAKPLLPVLLQVQRSDLPEPLRQRQSIPLFDAQDAVAPQAAEALLHGTARILGEAQPRSVADGPLIDALDAFNAARKARLRRLVEVSEDAPVVLRVLRQLAAHSYRPKTLNNVLAEGEDPVKKNRTALIQLYLLQHGLAQLEQFDSIKSGSLSITADGQRVLRLLGASPHLAG